MAPFEGLFLFFVNYRFEKVEIWPLKTNRMGRLFLNSKKIELGAVLAITHSMLDGSYSKSRLTRGR